MNHHRIRSITRPFLGLLILPLLATPGYAQGHGSHGTPHTGGGCEAHAAGANHGGGHGDQGTPGADHGDHGGQAGSDTATPSAEQPAFDLAYIDMMIPHHESVIALAEAAQGTLTDPRLTEMAATIIETQAAEVTALQALRDQLYPGAPATDATNHEVLHAAFPSLATWGYPMEKWGALMDAEALVADFCAAPSELTFVQLVIPHHEMAVLTSQDALTAAEHPEVTAVAENVIASQQPEIDLLRQIESELTAS